MYSMKVKKFVAKDMNEAVLRVKMEMGRDAVILATRKLRKGGFFGLFGEQMVEVTAAVEGEGRGAPIPKTAPVPSPKAAQVPQAPPVQPVPERERLPQKIQGPAGVGVNRELVQTVREEISELKDMVQRLVITVDHISPKGGYPAPLQEVYEALLGGFVEPELATRLMGELLERWRAGELRDAWAVREVLRQRLVGLLGAPEPIRLGEGGSCVVVAMVGPTGVGKTTTVAKLAARFALGENRDVALVAADTYRIAAVDQLKTYGEIIGVPVDLAFTPQELREVVESHRERALVFIDTAGRSHRNAMHMSELRSFMEAAKPDEIHLLLGAPGRYQDAVEVIEHYAPLRFNKLLFTKLDERPAYGLILSVATLAGRPLSYVTTGQDVPEDIEIADPEMIARTLAGCGD